MNVSEFLKGWHGKRVYYPPIVSEDGDVAGNHGDSLIEFGAEKLFKDVGAQFSNNPETADLLLLGGGGHMVEGFTSGPRMIRELSHAYPDTPLAVLPASFYFPHTSFAALIPESRAPITLFCREHLSKAHLEHDQNLPAYCTTAIDHDLAFRLAQGDLVNSVRSGSAKHILIVERWDAEHPDIKFDLAKARTLSSRLAGVLPAFVRAPLRPLVARLRNQRRTRFREMAERAIALAHPEFAELPRLIHDVSQPRYGSFESFTRSIADAAVIFTTRLHVGILAGMAGKPVYLVEGGYWKARGIHEYSMRDMPNVQFLDLDEIDSNSAS